VLKWQQLALGPHVNFCMYSGAIMKKLASYVIVFAGLIGTPALAADMAVKAPPAPVYSWTGFYVGGNVGYGFGSASNDLAFEQSCVCTANTFWSFNGSETVNLSGAIGGAQAGYNWQAGTFLYGIETDIQASGQKHTGVFSGAISHGNDPFTAADGNNPFTAAVTNKIDWFGTVRGRVGLTSDRWLAYATGGLAYGHANSSGIFQPATVFSVVPNAPFVWNNSATKVGWTIGAGIESAVVGNWSWKVEYLYMDLGKLTGTVSGGLENCYGMPGGGRCNGPLTSLGTMAVTSHFTTNIVRVGLNYKFGS
jgi:outer membrane immunogenic protein